MVTATFVFEYWRQLSLAECPYCGGTYLRRFKPESWEKALAWFSVRPYKCKVCKRRFYLRRAGHSGGGVGRGS